MIWWDCTLRSFVIIDENKFIKIIDISEKIAQAEK